MRRHQIKIIMCAVVVIGFAAISVGCEMAPPLLNEAGTNAQETLKAALDSYIEADAEGFYSYLSLEEPPTEADIEAAEKTAKVVGPEVVYEILSSNETRNKDNAAVRVKITAPNADRVVQAVEEAVEKKVKKTKMPSMTQAEIDAYAKKVLKKTLKKEEFIETTELFVSLSLVQEGNAVVWKIVDDSIYAPLFGTGEAIPGSE